MWNKKSGEGFTRTRLIVFLIACQVIAAWAGQAVGGREAKAAVPEEREGRILFTAPVPVKREGHILFCAPDDEEACTFKLKEWNVADGLVREVAIVPLGALSVSKDGLRLLVFNIEGGYYGDEPLERELTVLVYGRTTTEVPFGDPETFRYTLKPRYLSGIIYDDYQAKFYVDYSAGHH